MKENLFKKAFEEIKLWSIFCLTFGSVLVALVWCITYLWFTWLIDPIVAAKNTAIFILVMCLLSNIGIVVIRALDHRFMCKHKDLFELSERLQ